jgi:hypothetical protein
MRHVRTLLLLASLGAGLATSAPPALAYEPSLLNMTVPSHLAPGELDVLFEHRFYGSALDAPLENLFGLAIGANVGFGARYMILPGVQAEATYTTGGQELDVGAGYGYQVPSLPLGLQGEAELVSPQGTAGRGFGVFASLAGQVGPAFDILTLDVVAGYDSYLNHLGAGLAARVDLSPSVALVGELHPEDIGVSGVYSAGVMLTIGGHQFSLLAGNSTALGERRLMAGAYGFGALYLGFNIQRLF